MQEFLLLFRNASAPESYLVTTSDMAEDMPRWQAWIGNIAMQGKLVTTAPVEYNGIQIFKNDVVHGPLKGDSSVLVSGFLICKASGIEEVAEWCRECPILKYPESSVEIRSLTPFPIQ